MAPGAWTRSGSGPENPEVRLLRGFGYIDQDAIADGVGAGVTMDQVSVLEHCVFLFRAK